ncbi:MAG: prefoldin subunit beta [Candidatus Micrarchaeia archaeon]
MEEEMQKEIVRLQNFERQLQAVMMQKQQFQIQLGESKLALEELENASGDVYKTIGSVMIKTSVEDAKKDLEEKKELMESRMKTLGEQEEKLKGELTRLQKKLQEEMGSSDEAS